MESTRIGHGSRPPFTAARLADLVGRFEACTLPRDEWNHEAHLAVALVYLFTHGREEGARRIREGILRFNASHGVAQTRSSGYHETLTLFYTWAVGCFLASTPPRAAPERLVDELLARWGDRALPLAYYSRERLMSWEARTGWVTPDLRPLAWPPAGDPAATELRGGR